MCYVAYMTFNPTYCSTPLKFSRLVNLVFCDGNKRVRNNTLEIGNCHVNVRTRQV